MALLVTYAVFKSNQKPEILVFATPHYGKQSFIQLHIKNVGKSIAHDVKISSNRPLPRQAFGISKLTHTKEKFDVGIFKHGIKVFPANQGYIYDWGQYGGLKDALEGLPIEIRVTYFYKYPLNLWKTKITDISIIDINELEGLPASDGGLIEQLHNINNQLKSLNTKIQKKL